MTYKIKREGWLNTWLAFYRVSKNFDTVYFPIKSKKEMLSYYHNDLLNPGEFCQYLRWSILYPFIRMSLVSLLYISTIYLLMISPVSLGISLNVIIYIVAAIIIAALIISFGMSIHHLISKLSDYKNSKDGFISIAITAYNNKFCPIIEYTNEDGEKR